MSADNGIYIERDFHGESEGYSVYEYSASHIEVSPADLFLGRYPTLEEAIARGQKEYTEYGLSFGNLE